MNNRVLFPNLKLFKKEITERFLVATREIYKRHPVYTYNHEDDKESGILILPSYGNVTTPGKQPKFVIKVGSYRYGLTDTFNNNMSEEVRNSVGVVGGYARDQIIPTQLSVLVNAYAEEESSDMADELSALVVDVCRGMYSQVGLVIRGTSVSETDISNKEEDLYQTVVSISVDVPWRSSVVSESPVVDDTDIDFEHDLNFAGYRSPGVDILKGKV